MDSKCHNKSDKSEQTHNQTDANDRGQAHGPIEAKMETGPVCKNGVCELNWKPQRPHAA